MMTPLPPPLGPALSEQYPRILRFYARITREDGREPEYLDDLWAFFQNCWHLRDWIWHDGNIPGTRQKCSTCGKNRKFVTASTQCITCDVDACKNLKICEDLANYSKHLIKKGSSVIGEKKVRLEDAIVSGESTGSYSCDYVVALGGESKIDALELARRAIAEWYGLLVKWGLAQP